MFWGPYGESVLHFPVEGVDAELQCGEEDIVLGDSLLIRRVYRGYEYVVALFGHLIGEFQPIRLCGLISPPDRKILRSTS